MTLPFIEAAVFFPFILVIGLWTAYYDMREMKITEDSKSLIVWASSEDHSKIKSVVDQLSKVKTTSKTQCNLFSIPQ